MSIYCNGCNYWFDGGYCNKCYKPSCDSSCSPQNSDNCGCIEQVSGKCVFYQSATTTCLGITKGTTYDNIISAIDTKLCTLGASAVQQVYVTQGTSNEIAVSSATVGNTTTYTVRLDDNVLNHLEAIDSTLSDLEACVSDSIQQITSSSLLVTSGGTFGCGKSVNIEYIGSPIRTSGILSNDTLNTTIAPGTSNQVVLDRVLNFTAKGTTTQDIIELNYSLQVGSSTLFTLNILNDINTIYSVSFITGDTIVNSVTGKTVINLTSLTTALVNTEIHVNKASNEASPIITNISTANRVTGAFSATRANMTNINLSALRVRIIMTNNGTSTNDVFGDLVSEIKFKI
jgi:hypothetical protein